MRMAAIYARVSSEQQREENTIASQIAAIAARGARNKVADVSLIAPRAISLKPVKV